MANPAYTYTSDGTTDLNQVRLLVRDTGKIVSGAIVINANNAFMSDEEITRVVNLRGETGDARVFMAAADCQELIYSRFASAGQGKTEKHIADLRIKWGISSDVSTTEFISGLVKRFRLRAMNLQKPNRRVFRRVSMTGR